MPNRTVVVLGLVSLCSDLASKMVYPITPIFLTAVLSAPVWTVGVVEGVAESMASLLKLYSGWLSDRVGRRKPLALAGYGLGAISKLALAFAGGWGQVLGARLIDRTGKGLRAVPRDVMITENCPASQRGRAFGLHHSLETLGEIVGPLLGAWLLQRLAGGYRGVFAIATLPALLGILLLTLVREPASDPHQSLSRPQFTLQGLSPVYRHYLLVVGLFSLGNSSDAFLLLRARDLGFTGEQLLLLYTLFNLVEITLGFAVGHLSDRVGRRPVLVSGYLVFALVYLGFAMTLDAAIIWLLFGLYGLYSALTRGVQKAFVADFVHPERRGAETGTFYVLTGLTTLPASLIAGWLYAQIAASSPFYVSAGSAIMAALLLMMMHDDDASASMP